MRSIDDFLSTVGTVLTDLRGGEYIFKEAFECRKTAGFPINNVLELGVYRLYDSISYDLPGQSTKILIALCCFYNASKFISLDIDDCYSTISHCQKWCKNQGFEFSHHTFVQQNSICFNVPKEFPNGIDFIFLDTNHDDNYPEKLGYLGSGGAGMTYKELCYYAPHLSENGSLFIHDTKNYYVPKGYGVNTIGAIQRFLDENDGFEFIEHYPNKNGLGEIYRRGSKIAYLKGKKND